VLVVGVYEELRNAADRDDAERRCHALFQDHQEWWFPAMAKRRSAEPRGVVLFRIRIEQVTGRRSTRSDIATSSP
jgi:nitroimidazol reductase NimA-like FMN-containing flavoprotein (pyridoxamine 5'-phosphate oxidase superfamily)